jgi:hypothetical protein
MPPNAAPHDHRAMRIAILLAVAASALAGVAQTARAATPRVLQVVATGWSVEIDPTTVGLEVYTLQVHNLGQTPVRVRMPGKFSVIVPANGWKFPVVDFRRAGSYRVEASVGRGQPIVGVVSAKR